MVQSIHSYLLTLLTVQVSMEIVTLYISSCLQLKLQKNEFLHLVTQFSTLREYFQYIYYPPLPWQQLPEGSVEDHPLQDLYLCGFHLSGILTSLHQRLIYLIQMTQEVNLYLVRSPRFKKHTLATPISTQMTFSHRVCLSTCFNKGVLALLSSFFNAVSI